MVLVYSMLALLGGMLFPVQTALNAQLGRFIGGALPATIVSFVVGLTALSAVYLATSRVPLDWALVRDIPPVLFVGGLLGATFLGLSVYLIPRIGSGTLLCLVVAGQILTALAIDAFGLFGLATRDLSPARIIGALLVAGGAILVRLF